MKNRKSILGKLLAFCILVFSTNLYAMPNVTLAEDNTTQGSSIYYVSPDSTSTDWTAATDIDTPCTVDTAFKNAISGDTVYFLEGTYETYPQSDTTGRPHYHAVWEPKNSGTEGAPITFAAYPGAEVIINGNLPEGTTAANDSPDMIRVFSTGRKDYIIFDGFIIQANNGTKMGSVIIGYDINNNWIESSDNCIIRNCTFDGGSTTILGTDNRECIRLEWTKNTLIQNCMIKNAKQINDYGNTSGIKMYFNRNVIRVY